MEMLPLDEKGDRIPLTELLNKSLGTNHSYVMSPVSLGSRRLEDAPVESCVHSTLPVFGLEDYVFFPAAPFVLDSVVAGVLDSVHGGSSSRAGLSRGRCAGLGGGSSSCAGLSSSISSRAGLSGCTSSHGVPNSGLSVEV
jgi:hypothetical protein